MRRCVVSILHSYCSCARTATPRPKNVVLRTGAYMRLLACSHYHGFHREYFGPLWHSFFRCGYCYRQSIAMLRCAQVCSLSAEISSRAQGHNLRCKIGLLGPIETETASCLPEEAC